MERSGNFYKAIRLGYILISILIGCMVKMFGQGNIRRWREKGLVEPVSKRPGKIEYRVSDLRILQQRKQELIQNKKKTSNPQPIGFRGILLVKRQKFILLYIFLA